VAEHPAAVLRYASDGTFAGIFTREGRGPGEISGPARVAVGPGDSVWVSELQGRVVVHAPEGAAVRTLVHPELLPVEGFLGATDPVEPATGPLPWAMGFRVDRDEGATPRPKLLAVTLEPATGRVARSLGPGGEGSTPRTPLLVAPGARPSGEGFLVTAGSGAWIERWDGPAVDTLLAGDAVEGALRDAGVELAEGLPEPVALLDDGADGFWVLGRLRRIDDEEEDAIKREESERTGFPGGSLELDRSVGVMNRVWQGLLLHWLPASGVTHVVTLDHLSGGGVPLGAVQGSGHFFTAHRTERGLVQLRIWRPERRCG
jgi:hypothetical protein